MLKPILIAFAGVAMAFMTATSAAAWTEPAHRTIAEIAAARLTPEARAAVNALLSESRISGEPSCPVASLADAAAYVDCVDGIRRFNNLRKLHYEAVPLCGVPDKNSYCKDGQCVTEAIKRASVVLADPLAPRADKLFALEQLAHFIGDLHQPFQMVDNKDERGEDVRVALPGTSDRRMNLHRVWDENLPAMAVGSGELGAAFVAPLAEQNEAAWSRGGIDQWANETHQLGKALYARLPEPAVCGKRPRDTLLLDRAYVQSGTNTVREQIAKAGLRLAAVLNATFR